MKTITFPLLNVNNEYEQSPGKLLTSVAIWTKEKTYWMKNVREKVLVEEALTIKMVEKQIHSDVQYANIFVKNHSPDHRSLKLLVVHHFAEIMKEQFCFVAPTDQLVYHLARQQIYLANGYCNGVSIRQATVQPLWNIQSDQFWKCPQQGILKYQPLSKGPAASIFVLDLQIAPQETERAAIWTISSKTKEVVNALNDSLLKNHTSISI